MLAVIPNLNDSAMERGRALAQRDNDALKDPSNLEDDKSRDLTSQDSAVNVVGSRTPDSDETNRNTFEDNLFQFEEMDIAKYQTKLVVPRSELEQNNFSMQSSEPKRRNQLDPDVRINTDSKAKLVKRNTENGTVFVPRLTEANTLPERDILEVMNPTVPRDGFNREVDDPTKDGVKENRSMDRVEENFTSPFHEVPENSNWSAAQTRSDLGAGGTAESSALWREYYAAVVPTVDPDNHRHYGVVSSTSKSNLCRIQCIALCEAEVSN